MPRGRLLRYLTVMGWTAHVELYWPDSSSGNLVYVAITNKCNDRKMREVTRSFATLRANPDITGMGSAGEIIPLLMAPSRRDVQQRGGTRVTT